MKQYFYARNLVYGKKPRIKHVLRPVSFGDMSGPAIGIQPESGSARWYVKSRSGMNLLCVDVVGDTFTATLQCGGALGGPTIRRDENGMTFGWWHGQIGFFDSFYRVKQGEPIRVGFVDCGEVGEEKPTHTVIEESLDCDLSLPFAPDIEAATYQRRDMVGGQVEQYVIGPPESKAPTIAAVIDANGDSYIGGWKENSFDGLVLFVSEGIYILRRYHHGVPDGAWEIRCSLDAMGIYYILCKDDGTYMALAYDHNAETGEMDFHILQLDARMNRYEGGGDTPLPDYGALIEEEQRRLSNPINRA